jgi:hypothetical protein
MGLRKKDDDAGGRLPHGGGTHRARKNQRARGASARSKAGCGFDGLEWCDGGNRGRIFICGDPGCGKTTELLKRCEPCQRVVVFNTLGSIAPPRGWVEVSTPYDLLFCMMARPAWKLIYTPRDGTLEKHFDRSCEIVKAVRGVVFAVDELGFFTGPNYLPPAFAQLAFMGRHARVCVIATSQYVVDVPRKYTSACMAAGEIAVFRQLEPAYLKAWEERAGKEFAARLPHLKQFEFATWKPGFHAGK